MLPQISELPDPPAPADSPAVFNQKALAWTIALNDWTVDVNALVDELNILYGQDVVNDATTARTITADDAGKYIRFTNTSAKAITFQDEEDEPLPDGFIVHFRIIGTGVATITPDAANTFFDSVNGGKLIPVGSTVSVKRVAENTFDIIGYSTGAPA